MVGNERFDKMGLEDEGVLPAVLYYYSKKIGFSDKQVIHTLATAGLIGNLIKTNASISGAECGCQAEIGSACAMATAALGELFDLSIEKIEYAAEIAIEHHNDVVKSFENITSIL